MKNKKLDWLTSECASELFPMRILQGTYLLPENKMKSIPCGPVLCNGWGNLGMTVLGDNEPEFLPEGIVVTWYSFVEDVFYKGEFKFDEKLFTHFEKGFDNPNSQKREQFQYVLVGLGPLGQLNIWLYGEGVVKLVYTFFANKIQVDWKTVEGIGARNRAQYRTEVIDKRLNENSKEKLSRIKDHQRFWSKLQTKFPLEFTFLLPAQFKYALIKFTNGEKLYFNESSIRLEESSIPEMLLINWTDFTGVSFQTKFELHTDELYGGISLMKKTTELIHLLIEIHTPVVNSKVCLINETEYLSLRKIRINHYQK